MSAPASTSPSSPLWLARVVTCALIDLLGIHDARLGARSAREKLGAHVDALLQGRDERFLGGYRGLQPLARRRLLLGLGFKAGDDAGELRQIASEHAALALQNVGGRIGVPGD